MNAIRYMSEAWGFVPARGGSKTIPRKNLVPIGGRPLLDYVVLAGQKSGALSRVVGSSDDPDILAHMSELGLLVHKRPQELSTDDAPVNAAVVQFLNTVVTAGDALPDILVLLQPTSPFLLPEHVTAVVENLRNEPNAGSCQTVIACQHHAHAVNQRVFDEGHVRFIFEAERELAYNKQRKREHFLLGNLIGTRTERIMAGENLFAKPSIGIRIPRKYGLDIDDRDDLDTAEALLAHHVVVLSHLT